jgi:FkbM family methyltransferase
MLLRWSASFVPLIAAGTRRLQTLQPHRSLRGLRRVANVLHRLLPPYQGDIQLSDGIWLRVDSNDPAERWLLYSGNYQPALTSLLQQHTPAGSFCIDVGANLGFYTLKLARWAGSRGRVTAFEANPLLVERIRENVTLNRFMNVDIAGEAVHDQTGVITFYVSDSHGKSSVHAEQVTRPSQTLVVQAITIDDYIRQHGWRQLDVIKLDIEGNDCYALLGASESLRRFRPFIVFEYWYNTPSDVATAAFDLLDTLNYSLSCLLLDGRQTPFSRETRSDGHVDVVCLPR